MYDNVFILNYADLVNPFPHTDAFWRLCSRRIFENIVTKEEIAQNFKHGSNCLQPPTPLGAWDCWVSIRLIHWCQDKWTSRTGNLHRKHRAINTLLKAASKQSTPSTIWMLNPNESIQMRINRIKQDMEIMYVFSVPADVDQKPYYWLWEDRYNWGF